jgi:hypothetical protein
MSPRPTAVPCPADDRPARSRRLTVAFTTLAAAVAVAAPAGAQSQGEGFLFKEPTGSFAIRGGFAMPGTGGDLFGDMRDQLTLGRSAFNGLTVGADLAFRLTSRFDLAFSADYAGSSTGSEFRDFSETVDGQEVPVSQTNTFRRMPLTASLKAYLSPRGHSIGTLAWMPEKFAPFVGIGGGVTYYKFEQSGDFVDFRPNPDGSYAIFTDDLVSSGWAPTAHGLVGLDVSLSPRFAFTTQGKYTVGRGKVTGPDYGGSGGYDRIDLSGFTATAGFYVRF